MEKKIWKKKKKHRRPLSISFLLLWTKKKEEKNDHELESCDIEESSCCKSRIFRQHSIFVSWGSPTFRTHEIFVQPLTAADSLTCFEFLVCILFSYGSRRVQTIRKYNAYEIFWISIYSTWFPAETASAGNVWLSWLQASLHRREISLWILQYHMILLPWTKKKEPSPRFAARRTLFDLEISWSMTHDQRRAKSSATVRDFCPALIVRHRAWHHMMEQRSSRHESRGWFFLFAQRSLDKRRSSFPAKSARLVELTTVVLCVCVCDSSLRIFRMVLSLSLSLFFFFFFFFFFLVHGSVCQITHDPCFTLTFRCWLSSSFCDVNTNFQIPHAVVEITTLVTTGLRCLTTLSHY